MNESSRNIDGLKIESCARVEYGARSPILNPELCLL